MSNNGGVLKSGWVVVNPANTRIIDSNARAEAKLRELAVELAKQCGEEPDFADGFTQGIDAVEVSKLIQGEEGNIIGAVRMQRKMSREQRLLCQNSHQNHHRRS